jgi:hypothetical protein
LTQFSSFSIPPLSIKNAGKTYLRPHLTDL